MAWHHAPQPPFDVELSHLLLHAGLSRRSKQPKLTAAQQQLLIKQHATGEHTVVELAEIFNVSRPTVYRVLERARAGQTV